MLHPIQRAEVAETALGLLTTGLIVNTSGNVSVRVGEHIVITPSGRDYKSLTPTGHSRCRSEGLRRRGRDAAFV